MVINWLKKLFAATDPVEKYLSESADLVDLEARMKELKRKGIWV